MARILAVETSGDACSVALLLIDQQGASEVQYRHRIAPREHTHLLLPMIDELLVAAGLGVAQLDAIALGCGPGSFTGLRISAGVVQGLAFAAGLPVVSVSSLAAIARAALLARPGSGACRALVCMDARMGELYVGAYDCLRAPRASRAQDECAQAAPRVAVAGAERGPAATVVPVAPGEALVAPADWPLPQWLRPGADHLALGSGWAMMAQIPGAADVPWAALDTEILPHAADIAWLGLEAWRRGETLLPHQVEPVYLREQVAWRKIEPAR